VEGFSGFWKDFLTMMVLMRKYSNQDIENKMLLIFKEIPMGINHKPTKDIIKNDLL
jgi:hypothetical protein